MKEKFDNLIAYLKANKMIAIAAGAVALFFILPKLMKLGRTRKRRRSYRPVAKYTRRRTVKRAYNKNGKAKRPWQIKGSLAAKRHMAQIRKRR